MINKFNQIHIALDQKEYQTKSSNFYSKMFSLFKKSYKRINHNILHLYTYYSNSNILYIYHLIKSNWSYSNSSIILSFLNSAFFMTLLGLPVFFNHSFSSLVLLPYAIPITVPFLVFWTHPTKSNSYAFN